MREVNREEISDLVMWMRQGEKRKINKKNPIFQQEYNNLLTIM